MNGPRGENSCALRPSKTKDWFQLLLTRYMAPCHVKWLRWFAGDEGDHNKPLTLHSWVVSLEYQQHLTRGRSVNICTSHYIVTSQPVRTTPRTISINQSSSQVSQTVSQGMCGFYIENDVTQFHINSSKMS